MIITGDGTEYPDCEAGYAEGFLWLYLVGMTMQQAATLAFDPTKTAHIEFHYGEMSDVYEGYTTCTHIHADTDGKVSVCLVKGQNNAAS
jgi:hypothetical protein